MNEWSKYTFEYNQIFNLILRKAVELGWDKVENFPIDLKREKLVPDLLNAIREANKTNNFESLREKWPLAHSPLIPHLNKNSTILPYVFYLENDSIIVKRGTHCQNGNVYQINDLTVSKIEDIEHFGRSLNRKYFCYLLKNEIRVTEGWLGKHIKSCKLPLGNEGIPEKFKIKPSTEKIIPTKLIPFPDGQKVLFISSKGIFILTENEVDRILPTNNELIDEFEQRLKNDPNSDLNIDLTMENATISLNGKYIVAGSQISSHYIYNEKIELIGQIGSLSEYPHHCLFVNDDKYLILNSCHFFNGNTIRIDTKDLEGADIDPFSNDSKYKIMDNIMRVYDAIEVNDLIIFGDAYGFLHAKDINGNLKWIHFIGSTISSIDYIKEKSILLCTTAAGFLSIIKLNANRNQNLEIGTDGHSEIRRWIFWENEEKPLAW